MSRVEFMRRLAELLADVSPAEREEAIQYYNDYFDDAGTENEQSVIASLGTPEELAKTIKAGLFDGGNTGEFTEKGFSGYEQRQSNEILNPNQLNEGNKQEQNAQGTQFTQNDRFGQQQYNQQQYNGQQSTQQQWQANNAYNAYTGQTQSGKKQEKQPMSGGTIVLIVLLCILASPFLLGIGVGALGTIIGILGALFGIVVGVGAVGVALIIAGVCLFVYGIVLLFGAPLGGLCVIGAAMVCIAIGLVFFWLVVMICAALIPAVIKGIVKIFQSIFPNRGNKGGVAA